MGTALWSIALACSDARADFHAATAAMNAATADKPVMTALIFPRLRSKRTALLGADPRPKSRRRRRKPALIRVRLSAITAAQRRGSFPSSGPDPIGGVGRG